MLFGMELELKPSHAYTNTWHSFACMSYAKQLRIYNNSIFNEYFKLKMVAVTLNRVTYTFQHCILMNAHIDITDIIVVYLVWIFYTIHLIHVINKPMEWLIPLILAIELCSLAKSQHIETIECCPIGSHKSACNHNIYY